MALFKKNDEKKGESRDKKTLKLSEKVENDLKKYFEHFAGNWDKETRLYYGDIWTYTTKYRPYENNAFEVIEGQVAILTDAMSSVVAKVTDDAYKEQAENLSHAIEWVYKDQNLLDLRTCAIRNGLVAAPGYLFKWYDPNCNNGDGADKIELLDWDMVYLDGAAKKIEDSRKAVFKVKRDRSWLKLRYPDKTDEIDKAKGSEKKQGFSKEGRETKDVQSYHRMRRPANYHDDDLLTLTYVYIRDWSTTPIDEEETIKELQDEQQALLNLDSPDVNKWQDHKGHLLGHDTQRAELYAELDLPEDATFEQAEQVVEELVAANSVDEMGNEVPELAEQASDQFQEILLKIRLLEDHMQAHELLMRENPKGHRLKYRGGWRVIEKIEKCILRDGENQHEHNEIPLVLYYGNRDGTIYGFSDLRNIWDSENMRAVMAYKEYKGLQKIANPGVLASHDSQLTEDDWSNEDGFFLEVEDINNSIRFMQPGVISEQVHRFQQDRALSTKNITGMTDATQGKIPHPNASGHAVEKLQQQAIGRIRLKTRSHEESDRRLGKLIASDILQFWTHEKTLKLETKDQESTQIIFNPLEMVDLEYEIDIAHGSLAGVDKDALNTLMWGYVMQGIITPEQYFSVAEVPKSEKLMAFVEGNNQQLQEVQAQGEEIAAQAQELEIQLVEQQKENMKLRAAIDINLLSPEEQKALEEIQREENVEQITGVTEDQPEQGIM